MTDPTQRAHVIAVADEENKSISEGELSRFLAILADDCVMMPPNSEPVSGPKLKNWMSAFFETTAVTTLHYDHRDVVIAGDWAWHEYACQWKVKPKAGGPVATPRFKGLHIMRRASDASWRIVRNIWNLDPAPAD